MQEENINQSENEENLDNSNSEYVVSVSVDDFNYLVQVQEHILGTNLTFLLFFFIYCFCCLIHLLFKNF